MAVAAEPLSVLFRLLRLHAKATEEVSAADYTQAQKLKSTLCAGIVHVLALFLEYVHQHAECEEELLTLLGKADECGVLVNFMHSLQRSSYWWKEAPAVLEYFHSGKAAQLQGRAKNAQSAVQDVQ